jgi:hypothetical protein
MSDLTRDHLNDIIDPLKDDIKKVLEGIEKQNGRVRDLEVDVAVLKDRQPQRQAIVWGSAAGAFVGALGLLADFFFRK